MALRRRLLGLPKGKMHWVGVLMKEGKTFEQAMKLVTDI